jgi:CDK-activating kinase assembly factor MAT1
MELEGLIEEEKHHDEKRKRAVVEEEQEEKRKKLRSKEALIDELMFSEQSAKSILETFKQRKLEEEMEAREAEPPPPPPSATQFSTGIKFGQRVLQGGFLPVPKDDDTPMYKYESDVFDRNGPDAPKWEQLESDKFIVHVRAANKAERAGGYVTQLACLRALEEAFDGLYSVASKKWTGVEL